MTLPFNTIELDIIPIVEKEATRKIKCAWCPQLIERDNDFVVRSIKTDIGEIKGNFHLGCSSALSSSSIELLKNGWVKSGNECGQALETRNLGN